MEERIKQKKTKQNLKKNRFTKRSKKGKTKE